MFIDLSQPVTGETPVYPNTLPPRFTLANTLHEHGFKEYYMHITNHLGTHIDTPAHILEDGDSLDKFKPEHFAGKAQTISCTGKIINLSEIKQVSKSGMEILLFHTGTDKHWGTKKYFEDFPVLSEEAAKYIVQLGIKAVGIDAISFDKVSDAHLPIHHILLGGRVLLIENLTNLQCLAGKTCKMFFFPLSLTGLDASPVRAIAEM